MHRPSAPIAASAKIWRTRFLLTLGIVLLAAKFGRAEDTRRNLTVYGEDIVIGHLADGEGWTTTITLVNLDSTDAPFQLSFLGNNGQDLSLPFQGQGNQTTLTGTIPFRGTLTFQTTGTSAPVQEGWGYISSNQLIGGMAVFSFHRSGFPDFEAVVPFTSYLDLQQVMAFDERNGFRTGMALANFLASSLPVTMQFVDENGVGLFSDTVNLPAGGHTSFLLTDRYPQLADKRGTIQFFAQNGALQGLTVVGLRVNPQGPITTIFPMRAPSW